MSETIDGVSLTAAAQDVLAERRRQMEVEGWTPAHDDAHRQGELARAAATYALASTNYPEPPSVINKYVREHWPWALRWWKPKGRRRDLVRAGALILAEIERLDRKVAAAHVNDAVGYMKAGLRLEANPSPIDDWAKDAFKGETPASSASPLVREPPTEGLPIKLLADVKEAAALLAVQPAGHPLANAVLQMATLVVNLSSALEATCDLAEKATGQNAAMREALKPFGVELAGELFAANRNASETVARIAIGPTHYTLTAGDFFRARVALAEAG